MFSHHTFRWQPGLLGALALGLVVSLPPLATSQETPPVEPAATEAQVEAEPAGDAPQGREVREFRFSFDEFTPDAHASKILEGREWTPLTELTPLLQDDGREQVRRQLAEAEETYGLKFIVITADSSQLKQLPILAMALLKERLALSDGGVIICTENPRVQVTAFTTILETRLGAQNLNQLSRRSLEMASLAVGPNEQTLSAVDAVLGGITKMMEELRAPSTGTPYFGTDAPSEEALATDAGAETASTATASPAQAALPANAQASSNPASLLLVGLLGGVVVAGLGVLIGWQISRGAQHPRREASTHSGLTVSSEPRTADAEISANSTSAVPAAEGGAQPPAEPVLPGAAGPEKKAPFIKPRAFESRKSRHAAKMPPEFEEWAENFGRMVENNRKRSVDEPFDPSEILDRLTLQEIQMHYRALFKVVPPAARPALAESLEKLIASMGEPAEGSGGGNRY